MILRTRFQEALEVFKSDRILDLTVETDGKFNFYMSSGKKSTLLARNESKKSRNFFGEILHALSKITQSTWSKRR